MILGPMTMMTLSDSPISNAVLLTLFPNLCRLNDYLRLHLNPALEFVSESDSIEYRSLLQDTLVGTTEGSTILPTTNNLFPSDSTPCPNARQDELVDRVIELTCPRYRGTSMMNILASGYFNTRTRLPMTTKRYRNTLESFVRSPLWETLSRRIGEAAMLFLLMETSIFAALPNNCYCQITGAAVNEFVGAKLPIKRHLLSSLSSRKRPAPAAEDPASSSSVIFSKTHVSEASERKRRKKDSGPTDNSAVPLTTIYFNRTKIFYAKPRRREESPLHLVTNASVDTLMEKMFPRQHALKNVFQTHATASTTQRANPTDGKQKAPKRTWRLRQMEALVEDMQRQGVKCKQHLLLKYYCPVKALDDAEGGWDATPEALLKNHSTFDEVTSFVHAMVKKTIPLAIFGSMENRTLILRTMSKFISLRKFESMSLVYALQGFKLGDCEWLKDQKIGKVGSKVVHVPPTASMKQHEILHELVYWLFEGFLIPLLQSNFYVTDCSYQRNKMLYFRHDLWRKVTKPALATLQSRMFIKMDQKEIATCNKMYSTLRLLPKEHDLRPISNLRRKTDRLVNGSPAFGAWSANQQVANAFLVLSYERARHSPTSSANGMSDLYHRLKKLKEKLVDSTGSEQKKLYMVKVDIKKSFDSINQAKLMDVMNSILKEDKYLIHRHSKLIPSNGRIVRRYIKRALPAGEMPSFVDHAQMQAMTSKHALFIDKVVHAYQTKSVTLDLLRDHVLQNIVKFGKDFYRQTTGIPQGSVLSPALCRFFYDEMERQVLTELAQSNDNALVRLADDFLFISRTEANARTFLEQMSAGHPEYGCYINEKKTVVNFDVTLNGSPVQKCLGNEFPYCGLLLHTKTLEISADFGRYQGEDIRDLLTVGRDKHPGRSITHKMKKGMQHMCQMAFSDTTHNSLPTVMRNIYQNFVFCAMKFHAYCQELWLDPTSRHHLRASALPSVVMGIFKSCFGLLHNGRRSTVGIQAGVRFQVAERHVHWLGAMAFCAILPRLEIYAPLRVTLQEQILGRLAREEKIHFKRMLFAVVKDPRNKIMEGIRYER